MPSKPSSSLRENGVAKYLVLSFHVVTGDGKSETPASVSYVSQEMEHQIAKHIVAPTSGSATLSVKNLLIFVEFILPPGLLNGEF